MERSRRVPLRRADGQLAVAVSATWPAAPSCRVELLLRRSLGRCSECHLRGRVVLMAVATTAAAAPRPPHGCPECHLAGQRPWCRLGDQPPGASTATWPLHGVPFGGQQLGVPPGDERPGGGTATWPLHRVPLGRYWPTGPRAQRPWPPRGDGGIARPPMQRVPLGITRTPSAAAELPWRLPPSQPTGRPRRRVNASGRSTQCHLAGPSPRSPSRAASPPDTASALHADPLRHRRPSASQAAGSASITMRRS
jgi:hypothetical protein